MKSGVNIEERIRRAEQDLASAEQKRQRIEQAIQNRRKALNRLRSLLPDGQDAADPMTDEQP